MKLNLVSSLLCGALALGVAQRAGAAVNLVQNGDFEQASNGGGELVANTVLAHWSTSLSYYNILFTSGSADTTGVPSLAGNVKLWGPNDGSANGLPASSPSGGNYVGADAADLVGPITQTITGLTPGEIYQLSFYWGGVQEYGNTSSCTYSWQVSLGSETHDTTVLSTLPRLFTGWFGQSFNYTANNTSETLSFLAAGGPAGLPPFALLDGVSLVDTGTHAVPVPEPASVFAGAASLLLLMGGGVRGWFRRRTGE